MSLVTIVDVLENALSGDFSDSHIDSLSIDELDTLAEVISQFYDAWETPNLEGIYYSGGWIAGNPGLQEAKQYLLTSLVYYPRVVVHDTLADWFDRRRSGLRTPRELSSKDGRMRITSTEAQLAKLDGYFGPHPRDADRTKVVLRNAVRFVDELAPLIRDGIVIPVPQWRIVRRAQESVLASVRHDVRDGRFIGLVTNPIDDYPPRTDQIRGFGVTPGNGWRAGDEWRAIGEDPSYFLAKTLAIGEFARATYVPPAATDAALLRYKYEATLRPALRRRKVDLAMVAALQAADLPFLADVEPRDLVRIRRDEDAFDDWRRGLRAIVHGIRADPGDIDAFKEEASQIVEDLLIPQARAVARSVSGSAALRTITKDEVVSFGISAIGIVVQGLVSGQPPSEIAIAEATRGLSGVTSWLYRSIFRESPKGSSSVLATLIRNKDISRVKRI